MFDGLFFAETPRRLLTDFIADAEGTQSLRCTISKRIYQAMLCSHAPSKTAARNARCVFRSLFKKNIDVPRLTCHMFC